MTNLAYDFPDGYREERKWEKLNGVIYFMAPPSPSVAHGGVSDNIKYIFRRYLKGKTCRAFGENTDLILTENDTVIPDAMIVCNPDIIKQKGVYGAPELVVEILSRSSVVKDRTYKKDLYERCGIKEYWIVDAGYKTIDVFWLMNGKYVLNNVYFLPDEHWLSDRTQEENEAIVYEFKASIFDDLVIDIREVFEGVDDFE